MKKTKNTAKHDLDQGLAKPGTVNPPKEEEIKTEEPIAEKDEVKQAEEAQRKRMKSENS